jgi:CDP-paratose 2-epimerase
MRILVTGSGGLVGSEASLFFLAQNHKVYGIDNDTRAFLFGPTASVKSRIDRLNKYRGYSHFNLCISQKEEIDQLVKALRPDAIIHTAAQPSHDWAAKDPNFDFTVNALGTLNLLEAARAWCKSSPFIFTSTNKVYGDTPNFLPLIETETRWTLPTGHQYSGGIDETMSIDGSLHSLFGVSKASADLLVQEYNRYFGMNTAVFRCGCITGPEHRGAELHGFLSYLMRCVVRGDLYTVYGYKGKQVRDNIHAYDLVRAFDHFIEDPKSGVYNLGGGLNSNCSVVEAVTKMENLSGKKLDCNFVDSNRIGDHKWWISSNKKFETMYPTWELKYTLEDILTEIYDEALSDN